MVVFANPQPFAFLAQSIMRISANHVLLAFAFAGNSVLANMYSISSTVIGSDFLSAFGFEAIPDPTHGFVYVAECPVLVLALTVMYLQQLYLRIRSPKRWPDP